jgi:hypothetical protein
MKRILSSLLLLAGISYGVASCSSGAYVANPSSNANGSINPLKPLKAGEFTWSGTDPVSLSLNGAPWVADTAYFFYIDSAGTNLVWAKNGNKVLYLLMKNTWSNNVYNMGFKQYDVLGIYMDSFSASSGGWYQSALGNSGEVYMIENDSARITGKFYFQGVNASGAINNVTNGYFNISKI